MGSSDLLDVGPVQLRHALRIACGLVLLSFLFNYPTITKSPRPLLSTKPNRPGPPPTGVVPPGVVVILLDAASSRFRVDCQDLATEPQIKSYRPRWAVHDRTPMRRRFRLG